MKKVSYKQIYPLLILLALFGVGMFQRVAQQVRKDVALAQLKASPYWEPSTAHGIFCHSEVDGIHPLVRFHVGISHPPGNRELVNETVRRLVRTGATPQPWPETWIQRFRILRTYCTPSYEELYRNSYGFRREMYPFLKDIEHPTEKDYRNAALRSEFEEMGTVDEALEWFSQVGD